LSARGERHFGRRGLLRDGHDVTVFGPAPNVTAGAGRDDLSNGARLSTSRCRHDRGRSTAVGRAVMTSTGRPLATKDLDAMGTGWARRFGCAASILLERLLKGFPADRIRCNSAPRGRE